MFINVYKRLCQFDLGDINVWMLDSINVWMCRIGLLSGSQGIAVGGSLFKRILAANSPTPPRSFMKGPLHSLRCDKCVVLQGEFCFHAKIFY